MHHFALEIKECSTFILHITIVKGGSDMPHAIRKRKERVKKERNKRRRKRKKKKDKEKCIENYHSIVGLCMALTQ